MRGEYNLPSAPIEHPWELPPRARRIHSRGGMARVGHGTTSACAENTFPLGFGLPSARNYLRVRGEYKEASVYEMTYVELPPRARRIRPKVMNPWASVGTTSACAENTLRILHPIQTIRNYLRVRGEYRLRTTHLYQPTELPPRARRIQCGGVHDHGEAGTTSACAENTPNPLAH